MSPFEPAIGATLRDTRTRRKIDLAEVESETKIRVRYLRALEDEEWDVLPGGAYTRSFIRTYATFLGLDGERLADSTGASSSRRRRSAPRAMTRCRRRARRGPAGRDRRISRGALAGLISIALIAILIVDRAAQRRLGATAGRPRLRGTATLPADAGRQKQPQSGSGVTLRLLAEADVWVCLVDAKGNNLIDGGDPRRRHPEGPFRSGSFTVAFGNGAVRCR